MKRNVLVALGRVAVLATAVVVVGCANESNEDPTNHTQDSLEWDFKVELGSVTLSPGEERLICQYVPPDGHDHWLKAFDTETSTGAHHVAVFRTVDLKIKSFGPVDCGSANDKVHRMNGMLPGSNQQSGSSLMLPAGVAVRLGARDALYVQMHFVNSTSAPIETHVTWKAASMNEADVVHKAGLIDWNHQNFVVPPGESKVSETCELPEDMTLVMATGHMHQYGLEFSANVQGHRIFDTKEWSEPDVQEFGRGYEAKQGQPLTFTCTYGNGSGEVVKSGFLQTNEMCTFIGIYYPTKGGGAGDGISSCKTPTGRTNGGGVGGTNGGGDGEGSVGLPPTSGTVNAE